MIQHPITIRCYPWFGAWQAECTTCGAYASSRMSHEIDNKSAIGGALEKLAKNPNTFSPKSNGCKHFYGSYKPRVICQVDFRHLSLIKDTYYTGGCETFPSILLDNQYRLDVINASGLTHKWSAYSYVRHSRLQEEIQKKCASAFAMRFMPPTPLEKERTRCGLLEADIRAARNVLAAKEDEALVHAALRVAYPNVSTPPVIAPPQELAMMVIPNKAVQFKQFVERHSFLAFVVWVLLSLAAGIFAK